MRICIQRRSVLTFDENYVGSYTLNFNLNKKMIQKMKLQMMPGTINHYWLFISVCPQEFIYIQIPYPMEPLYSISFPNLMYLMIEDQQKNGPYGLQLLGVINAPLLDKIDIKGKKRTLKSLKKLKKQINYIFIEDVQGQLDYMRRIPGIKMIDILKI